MAQLYLDYARAPGHRTDGDPVGHQDMAELTGRTIYAVYKWFEREALPPADGPRVNGLPTWRRATFLAWAYSQFYTRDQDTNEPLPVHAEAERCHRVVSPKSLIPLRDLPADVRYRALRRANA